MAGRNRWNTGNPEVSYGSGPVEPKTDIHCCSWLKAKLKPSGQSMQPPRVDPGPDDCCCPCLKPKPDERSDAPTVQRWPGTEDIPKGNSNGSKKPDERSDAPKGQQWPGTVVIPEGNSNGSNKNTWSDNMQPNDSSRVPRDQRVIPKNNKYTENDPVETTKNGAVNEFKGKQVLTHDQENRDGIPGIGNMKPSPQHKKICSPGQDNHQEEIKKKGKNTGPNSTNVTKSKDGVYSSEEKQMSNIIPKQEDIDGSYGGTRPGSTKNIGNHGGTRSDPTKSSTFEQAGPWKDHIKNRQDDTLEDHHKAVHKPEYNHGIHRDKGNHGGKRSDPNKSSTFEYDRIKNRHEGILEDHHKAVHKPEYNHGIYKDTGPDLTKKESSSPEQAAGVQKREGKQKETKGINNNDEQFKDC